MRIGILGGSFNPPHLGHRRMADLAVRKLRLDTLYVIPAVRPPHKEITKGSPVDEKRFKMTQIAFNNLKSVVVSDIEYKREGPSYTVDTISEIKKINPDSDIYLIMGTDMFLTLDEWYKYEEILSMCIPAVFAREAGQCEVINAKAQGWNVEIVENKIVPISSTKLREHLISRDGLEYVGEELYEYIIKERLYGAKPNLDWLRLRAHAYLDKKRVPHVLGCEQEAARLAKRWGADVGDAREAAILHDITKNKDRKQQLILCEKYDIITDIVELQNVKLLHSKTGAELSKDLFGVSGEVYDAILWHTTGRPGMGLLEQVIYMADYIEPTRDFPGVEKLRELAYSDLRSALMLGLKMSIDDLKQSGRTPHQRTIETLEWLGHLGV